jgi:hypothetical protein
MRDAAIFFAGVATGWVLRSSFDSFRDVTVRGLSAWYDVNERVRRFVAVEREYFEDIFAEARSRFEATRARRTGRAAAATPPTARA